jgi:hypothetical protein
VEEPKDKREKSKLQAIGGDLNKSAKCPAKKRCQGRRKEEKKSFSHWITNKRKIFTADPGTIKIF